jgi:hypothetical protein
MKKACVCRLAVLAFCVASTTGCAPVQPAQSWPDLVQRLQPGTPIAVTDIQGTEMRGKVSAADTTSLTLNTAGAMKQFDAQDVRQVRRDGDPLWNGFVIGAGVGVLGAVLPDNRCSGQMRVCNDRQIPERLTFAAIATAAGVGIDALYRDRTVLYGPAARVALRVTPVLAPDSRGLSISLGF